METDYLQHAVELGQKNLGKTSPNPAVGCVIVLDGKIIAEAAHEKAGEPHAEILALKKAAEKAKGATLYVTLEPCSHQGKTGPCADAVIKAGIRRVVVGMTDPNPLVAGKGIERLKKAGIEVEVADFLPAQRLHEFHAKYITKKVPFVTIKLAATLDGNIAAKSGESRWITNDKTRAYTNSLRNQYDAILVGAGTVMKDDPFLKSKNKGGRDPLRVIIDSKLFIRPEANVFNDKNVMVATTASCHEGTKKELEEKGAAVLVCKEKEGLVDLEDLLKRLGERQITSVLVEGGQQIITSFLRERLADKVLWCIAPMIYGNGLKAVSDLSFSALSQSVKLKETKVLEFDGDCVIEGYIR